MSKDDELRQQLWDYVYGLLEPAEASALERRITSEHEVARAYAEVRQQADQLGAAARLEVPAIELRPPASATCVKYPAGSSRLTGLQVVAALALTLLVVLAAGIAWRRAWLNDPRTVAALERTLATEQVRLVVAAPPTLVSEQDSLFSVQASDLLDRPRVGDVYYELLAADGATVSEDYVTTDANGIANVVLTSDNLTDATEMRLAWGKAPQPSAFAVPLPTVVSQFRTHLTTNQTVYQAGDVAQFRSVTLAADTPRDVREFHVDYGFTSLEDPNVLLWQKSLSTQLGVGSGAFPLQPDWQGKYRLLASSTNQEFPEQVSELSIGVPASVDNLARNQLAAMDTDGIVPLPSPNQGTPLVAEPVLAQQEFVELQVAAGHEERQWIASVTCRGLLVGQQALANVPEVSEQRVALAPTGDGLLGLAIHDFGEQPPVALAQQWLYRAPTEFWRVAATSQEVADSPDGQSHVWAFTVQDEQQRPGLATLGVRVVADTSAPLATLADAYYLTPVTPAALHFAEFDFIVPNPQSAADLKQHLADMSASSTQAQPLPVVHDNTTQVEQRIAEVLRTWQLLRQKEVRVMTTLLQWGSVALLLLLVVLSCLRRAGTVWQWGPRLVIAGLLLIAALNWQQPPSFHQPAVAKRSWSKQREVELAQLAAKDRLVLTEDTVRLQEFSDLELEAKERLSRESELPANEHMHFFFGTDWSRQQPELANGVDLYAKFLPNIAAWSTANEPRGTFFYDLPEAQNPVPLQQSWESNAIDSFAWRDERRELGRGLSSTAQTLYWNPSLQTDEHGRAEIRFVVPDNGQNYLLQIDAHGQGRLGALRLPLSRIRTAN